MSRGSAGSAGSAGSPGAARSAYAVLGVTPDASVAQIRAAYRDRARKIHPDRFAGDPRQTQAATEAFVELNNAFRSALAAAVIPLRSDLPNLAAGIPSQRRYTRPVQPSEPVRSADPVRPSQPVPPRASSRGTVAPERQSDPLLALLTVPQRCGRPWSAGELETWALTIVPEARRHLGEAKKIARAAGVTAERHLTTATAHALLSLTVDSMNGPRVMGVLGRLDAAYDALEIVLPGEVVDRLPERVTGRRAMQGGSADDPSRTLLAFCAATGALAAATVWTHFFGFFVR